MATRSAKIDQKADLIWAIADKLTGVYKPHEYGDVILPLTVIRRFDCILSDTKDHCHIMRCREHIKTAKAFQKYLYFLHGRWFHE